MLEKFTGFCKYAKEYFLSLNFWYFPPCARMLDIFLPVFAAHFLLGLICTGREGGGSCNGKVQYWRIWLKRLIRCKLIWNWWWWWWWWWHVKPRIFFDPAFVSLVRTLRFPTYTRDSGSIVWLIWQRGRWRVIKTDRRHLREPPRLRFWCILRHWPQSLWPFLVSNNHGCFKSHNICWTYITAKIESRSFPYSDLFLFHWLGKGRWGGVWWLGSSR